MDVLPSLWLGVHVSEKRDLLQKAEGARGADPSLPTSKEYSVSLWLVASPWTQSRMSHPEGRYATTLHVTTQASRAGRMAGSEMWEDGDPKALCLQARKRGLERVKEWPRRLAYA